MTLADRIYHCDNCGFEIDRDLNAALNLKSYTASSVGINASGQDKLQVGNNQWSWLKEEHNTKKIYKLKPISQDLVSL